MNIFEIKNIKIYNTVIIKKAQKKTFIIFSFNLFISFMSTIIQFIKDIISPKICYSCKNDGVFLCQQCREKFEIKIPYCYICKRYSYNFEIHEKCKKRNIYYDKIIVLCHYKIPTIKKLIKDSKFYGKKDILDDFSKYLSEILLKNEKNISKEEYLIVSTPMFWLRRMIRWYNQSDILANNLSKKTSILYYSSITKKQKNTKQQSKLSKIAREKNLKNTFIFDKNYASLVKNIILVDDVVSTWTTINELSRILKQNWAKKVIWLVIASD